MKTSPGKKKKPPTKEYVPREIKEQEYTDSGTIFEEDTYANTPDIVDEEGIIPEESEPNSDELKNNEENESI
jgi:hypothetical protein